MAETALIYSAVNSGLATASTATTTAYYAPNARMHVLTEAQANAKHWGASSVTAVYVRATANGRASATTAGVKNSTSGSTLLATMTGSTTGTFSNTGTLAMADGDLYCFQSTTGTGTTGTVTLAGITAADEFTGQASVTLNGSSSTGGGDAYATTAVRYWSPSSDLIGLTATEANVTVTAMSTATLSHLSVEIGANAATNAFTVRTRKNGANGNQSVSITAGTTGTFDDTSNTDSVAITDTFNVGVSTIRADAGSVSIQNTSLKYTSGTAGAHATYASNTGTAGAGLAAATTYYSPLFGAMATSTSESANANPMPFAGSLSKVGIRVLTGATGNRTLTVRKNLAATTDTITVTGATSGWFANNACTTTFVAGDNINWTIGAATSGTTTVVGVGALLIGPVTTSGATGTGAATLDITGSGTGTAYASGTATVALVDSVVDGTDASLYSFAGRALGAAAADRAIVVGIAGRAVSSATTVTGVTVAGIAASLVTSSRNTTGGDVSEAALWLAQVPTGTTGTVEITTSANFNGFGVAVYRLTGLGSFTASDTDGAVRTNTAGDMSATLTTPAGVAIGVAFNGVTPHTFTSASAVTTAGSLPITVTTAGGSSSWSGLTEDADASIEVAANQEQALALAVWGSVTPVTGTGAATLAITGSASGARGNAGTAAATLAITGSGSGVRGAAGTAAATLALTGSASGVRGATGTAAATLAITGSAAGSFGTTWDAASAQNVTLSNGNLTATGAASAKARGSLGIDEGDGGTPSVAFTATTVPTAANFGVGFVDEASKGFPTWIGGGVGSILWAADGNVYNNGAGVGTHDAYTSSDVVHVRISGGQVGFKKGAGSWASFAHSMTGNLYPAYQSDTTGSVITADYTAWTATVGVAGTGAATLSITGAGEGVRGSTGTGSATLAITGSGAGVRGAVGTGSATLALTGSAAGKHGVAGTASATLSLTGSAIGTYTLRVVGAGSANLILVGEALGGFRVAFAPPLSGTTATAGALTGGSIIAEPLSGTTATAPALGSTGIIAEPLSGSSATANPL